MSNFDLTEEYIVQNSWDYPNTDKIGVYFLINSHNQVVYVGKTTRGMARIGQHVSEKIFNKIYFLPCSPLELDRIEAYYIIVLQPQYNKTHQTYEWISIETIKTSIKNIFNKKISLKDIKKDLSTYHNIKLTAIKNMERIPNILPEYIKRIKNEYNTKNCY